eukprot:7104896-Alexandrium_andersonii.AAC.1
MSASPTESMRASRAMRLSFLSFAMRFSSPLSLSSRLRTWSIASRLSSHSSSSGSHPFSQ